MFADGQQEWSGWAGEGFFNGMPDYEGLGSKQPEQVSFVLKITRWKAWPMVGFITAGLLMRIETSILPMRAEAPKQPTGRATGDDFVHQVEQVGGVPQAEFIDDKRLAVSVGQLLVATTPFVEIFLDLIMPAEDVNGGIGSHFFPPARATFHDQVVRVDGMDGGGHLKGPGSHDEGWLFWKIQILSREAVQLVTELPREDCRIILVLHAGQRVGPIKNIP
jgi:hypothetical protein